MFNTLTEVVTVLKRTVVVAIAAVVLVGLTPFAAFADMPKGQVSNTMAVCGCGMIFTPTAETKYIEFNGKSYACCTEGCHKMASGNPEMAATMSEQAVAKMKMKSSMKVGVANVTMVDDKGAHALCGCGKEFTLASDTPYLKAGDNTYACCTKACHDMVAKDPAKAEAMFKEQMAKKMSMK
jgi:hypothetical protein